MIRSRLTFDAVLRAACLALGGWILAGLALVSAVHIDDRYRVGHVSGVWMGLAQSLDDGTLYPPLYDGERFGGTRFMPLQVLLHGGFARVTGEYLVSGKLLALAVAALLLGLTLLALRRLAVPLWLALGLVGVLVTTPTGLTAMTTIRGDALPVALQLGALLAITSSTGRRGAVVAGALCAAALLSKISAVWASLAIAAWLLTRERRRLSPFLAAFIPLTLVALVVLELATSGRFSDNVLGLGGSALAERGDLPSALVTKPLTLLESDAAGVGILLPLALADLALAFRARRASLEHLAFVAAVLVTLVLMTDIGAVSNHLLDIEVLALLLAGHLWAEHGPRQPVVQALVPLAVVWAALGAYVVDMHGDVANATRSAAGRSAVEYPAEPLRALVPPGARLLSEDATIPITSGERPVVLDPFMLLRIVERHPEWGRELVRRLDRREFDRVVLLSDHVRADGSIEVSHPRWRREHFGRAVVAAIARNYRFRGLSDAYAVYTRSNRR